MLGRSRAVPRTQAWTILYNARPCIDSSGLIQRSVRSFRNKTCTRMQQCRMVATRATQPETLLFNPCGQSRDGWKSCVEHTCCGAAAPLFWSVSGGCSDCAIAGAPRCTGDPCRSGRSVAGRRWVGCRWLSVVSGSSASRLIRSSKGSNVGPSDESNVIRPSADVCSHVRCDIMACGVAHGVFSQRTA